MFPTIRSITRKVSGFFGGESSVPETRAATQDMIDNVACPFWKRIVASGDLNPYINESDELVVPVFTLVNKAKQFGLGRVEALAVASLVSTGQLVGVGINNFGKVNLNKLHLAKGVAHDDGFAFKPGSGMYDKEQLSETISYLNRNSSNGKISYATLAKRKQEIADSLGIEVSGASLVENKLLFAYLGGIENDGVMVSDIDKFFKGEDPATITTTEISKSVLANDYNFS